VAIGRASGGTPDKPEFPAQPEMRPDEKPPVSVSILQAEALYTQSLRKVATVFHALFVKFRQNTGINCRIETITLIPIRPVLYS
jgi:hypothetical protein